MSIVRFDPFRDITGKLSRSLTLPQGIKADDVAASFKDGVLEVTVPKADEVKPRKFAIASGEAA